MENFEIFIKDYFPGFDSKSIRYGCFGNKDYSKILVLLQGRAEYMEKYHHIVKHFINRGFIVFMLDWRGQGGSVRELPNKDKGYVNDFIDYQKDLHIFLNKIVSKYLGHKKVYCLAHSMGAHNAARYIIENKESFFSKVFLVSPMFGIKTYPLPQKSAEIISKIACKSGFKNCYVPGTGNYKETEFKNNPLTSDYEKFQDNNLYLKKHRELAVGGPTYSWLYNAFLSMNFILKNKDKLNINTDTKIIFGTDDGVVTEKPAYIMGNYTTHGIAKIQNARHEIMMENPEILSIFFEKADIFFS
jgi:lysophospholipase